MSARTMLTIRAGVNPVEKLAISSDGRYFACSKSAVLPVITDRFGTNKSVQLKIPRQIPFTYFANIAFSKSNVLFGASGCNILKYDPATGDCLGDHILMGTNNLGMVGFSQGADAIAVAYQQYDRPSKFDIWDIVDSNLSLRWSVSFS